jgi:hypothetical protein
MVESKFVTFCQNFQKFQHPNGRPVGVIQSHDFPQFATNFGKTQLTSLRFMMNSDRYDYSYWVTQFSGQYTPQQVREHFRDALASCTTETIPRTMSVHNWLLKSPDIANGILRKFEKKTWIPICQILGLVVSRDMRRNISHLIAHVESERTHINGMLTIPPVAQHIRAAILQKCAEEIDPHPQPRRAQAVRVPVPVPMQAGQGPAAPPGANSPFMFDYPEEEFNWDEAWV